MRQLKGVGSKLVQFGLSHCKDLYKNAITRQGESGTHCVASDEQSVLWVYISINHYSMDSVCCLMTTSF